MKKITFIACLLALTSTINEAKAQSKQSKEVKMEVNVEETNGEKVLTINTTDGNSTKTEVYRGAEADAKLAELEKKKSGTTKTMVIGEDGKKHLKVEKRVVVKETIDK